MRILKQISILGLAASFAIAANTRSVKANPAILAPAALCAGTAGVGCVLIGVAIVGGTAYYVWQRKDGTATRALASGESIETWNTEKENRHTVYGSAETCRKMGKRNGFGKMLKPIDHGDGTVTCRFEGKQTNFGSN